MTIQKALNVRLQKAKYVKRWRGKDGKYRYLYKQDKGRKKGLSDEAFLREAYALRPSAAFSSGGESAEKYVLYRAIRRGENKLSDYSLYVDDKTAETLVVYGNKFPANTKRFTKEEGFKLSDFSPYIVQWGRKNLTSFRTFKTEKGANTFAARKTGKVRVVRTESILK